MSINELKRLPLHLQSLITLAHTQLQQHADAEIDRDILMQIGTVFGSLQKIPQHYTRQHQRHLLLNLLTLYHLTPMWAHEAPNDPSFRHTLHHLTALVMRRLTDHQAHANMDSVRTWCEQPWNADTIRYTIALSTYTLAKVVEPIIDAYIFDDYPPDVHANVALICAADGYGKYAMQHQRDPAWARRTYWSYWLLHIVPYAWFPLPEEDSS
jgi:hypothetical protein